MTLVLDASVVVAAVLTAEGLDVFAGRELVGPALLWSEARSAIHQRRWRGELSEELAGAMHGRLETSRIERRHPDRLGLTAWEIADELGWAKTYDAEYLALARLLDTRVVTLDARLRRGADRLGLAIGPTELA